MPKTTNGKPLILVWPVSGGALFSYISYNSCLGKNKVKEKEKQLFPPSARLFCGNSTKKYFSRESHSDASVITVPEGHPGEAAQEPVCSNSELHCW